MFESEEPYAVIFADRRFAPDASSLKCDVYARSSMMLELCDIPKENIVEATWNTSAAPAGCVSGCLIVRTGGKCPDLGEIDSDIFFLVRWTRPDELSAVKHAWLESLGDREQFIRAMDAKVPGGRWTMIGPVEERASFYRMLRGTVADTHSHL